MSLLIKKLSKKYPDFYLKDISFDIKEGEIVGLIGQMGLKNQPPSNPSLK